MVKIKSSLLLSLVSASLLTLSWPTWGFPFLIFFGLIPLFFIENNIRNDNKSSKRLRLFFYTYLAFLLWNLGTTWWIVNSTVFGMVFANLCNALFYAIIFQLFYWANSKTKTKLAYIFFICLWLGFEKLHLNWDLSWPWLNLGNVFSEWFSLIQWYEFTGAFGGTLWILILNLCIYEIIRKINYKLNPKIIVKKFAVPFLILVIPCLVSLVIYNKPLKQTEDVKVLLLQPNIDSYSEKYSQTNSEFLDLLIEMTNEELSNGYDLVVTPETFFAEGNGEPLDYFPLTEIHNDILSYLNNFPQTQLLSGFQFYRTYKSDIRPTASSEPIEEGLWADFYNSAMDVQWGFPVEYYHKSKLVVGVENIPFKGIIRPLLGDVLIDLGGTVASRATQKERSVFTHGMKNIITGPIICYESIYGEFLIGYVRKGANLLAVLTNDSWWGKTPGHKQLLSYTRLRSIETRRDIVRSANTGISAIIDSKGRIKSHLEYDKKGILAGNASTNDIITFYVKYGDYIFRISFLVLMLITIHLLSVEIKKFKFKRSDPKK